jgi:hypothetical protein
MYFYKTTILRFLKEITSNSDKLEGKHENVLQTLFDDLELPTFKKNFISRHTNKLKFMKNLMKNLSKNTTIDNINAISQIVQNFSVSFDRNFYIQFDKNVNDDIVCKFYIVKLVNITGSLLRNKINTIKKNIKKVFADFLEDVEEENENFDVIQISYQGLNQVEDFYDFFKYYIKLKGRFFYANLNMGTMLLGLKSIEDDPSNGVLFSLSLENTLNVDIRAGIASFITRVYLFFKKYNYFIDDYEFTYFCQKL